MNSRAFDRREFLHAASTLAAGGVIHLTGLAGCGSDSPGDSAPAPGAPLVAAPAAAAPTVPPGPRTLVLSPQSQAGPKGPSLGVLDLAAHRLDTIPTPMLGHSIVGHPGERGIVAVLGQRPERTSCLVDLDARKVVRAFEATRERTFYGHGAYSPDGRILYATENHERTGVGVIVARDARSLVVLGEFPSHGMAPHEMAFSRDGKTAIVANGGAISIEGDYDDGPADLEAPSLCYIDPASARLLDRHTLPDPKMSIRHLAVTDAGAVIAALRRYPSPEPCQTLAWHVPGHRLGFAASGPDVVARMTGLALSVAVGEARRVAGATHPDGDLVTFWDARDGRWLSQVKVAKPEGIVALPDAAFLVTSRSGVLTQVAQDGFVARPIEGVSGLNWKHAMAWSVGGAPT
jgi:hypothetical protein